MHDIGIGGDVQVACELGAPLMLAPAHLFRAGGRVRLSQTLARILGGAQDQIGLCRIELPG